TTNLSAKRSLQQQSVDTLKSTIYTPENRGTVQGLGVDPENVSQEQIDRLKSTVTDTRGQSLLGYLSKYQQVKTELAQTNQSLFETQYNYIKSIADYNKGLSDQTISLGNRLANLTTTARSAISSLQQQVEQSLLEIDTTSSKAMFQSQRNSIQGAYNKFLDKLGISTDDIFEQIFQSYNSILDSIQQITERRLGKQQSAITANYRQAGNETRKYQTQTEQTQGLQEIQRQNVERQLSNPLNQLDSGTTKPVNNNPTNSNNLQLYRSQRSGLTIPVVGATNSRGGGYPADTGLDMMTPIGSKVVAAGAGTLEYAEDGHVRQIGEDVDPTTPGFQKQKSVRVKLDTPIEYQGKTYEYNYYTHLRSIASELLNKGTHSRTGLRQPTRIEAGQFLGETGTAGGGPHLHFGISADREQRNHLNYQEVHDVLFGTKDTSPKSVGKVLPVQANQIAQVAPTTDRVVPQVDLLESDSSIQSVNSSTYTPGGGGMNAGEIDSRGNRLTRNDYAIAIPGQNRVKDQIPYGSIVKLNYGGKTVNAKVTDGGPYIPGRQMDMTTAAAKALGFNGVGQVGVQLQSLPKGADPNKKYYFGEATYKPQFDKKGNVSHAEANKAIASVVQGDKYLTLGNTVRSTGIDRSPSVGKGFLGQAILNHAQQQGVDESIQNNAKLSNEYVTNINQLSDRDSLQSKQKLRQDLNLANQQDDTERTKIDTQILKNRNLTNQKVPAFNRRSTELEQGAAAYNRSENRSAYQQIDKVYQQYGGIPNTATLDTTITDAQSSVARLKEESRVRRENLLKQIESIESAGAGWANLRKTTLSQISSLRKNGYDEDADKLQDFIGNNDRAIGTPKARQVTINRLSKQYQTLPSDGSAVYDAIAPGAGKVLSDNQALSNQYLPKTFGGDLQAEARSIIDRFKAAKEALTSEFNKLDEAISILESEIQAKLKAAGYSKQKIDLNDPKRLELLEQVAPEETARLKKATATRSQVIQSGEQLDRNVGAAADRSVSIGQKREQLQVDRLKTDYLATTQDGNLFTKIETDKQRFTQGKTDLDLQFDQGAISADLYAARLKQLGLETNTLKNAINPLRSATTGFFSDIFAGIGAFDGIDKAVKNLAINIVKNFQDLISKHLGQQLFGSLANGAEDMQGKVASGKDNSLFGQFMRATGLVNPGSKPNTTSGIDIGLTSPVIDDPSENLDFSIFDDVFKPKPKSIIGQDTLTTLLLSLPSSHQKDGGSDLFSGLTGMLFGGGNKGNSTGGLDLGFLFPEIPGFATGGIVNSPTVALVGEGIHNEAIVPLPNGRSIPVDLSGMQQPSNNAGNVNSSVSVTIQNNGQAKETSQSEGTAISQLIKGAVMDILINERRTGGLLS
ncbi:hypothetical protein, partial [Chamaesiphon sp. VAR_48_metabat_135_sub]|uniref:hypothetical protein n=1 Tax=Chamaesiphon sp. VAR_48_metabat_135_sub TaxID=2964699 RepID=UPI00286B0529